MTSTPSISDKPLSWSHEHGALAWVKKQGVTEPSLWVNRWPVLLYPSWSTAMASLGSLLLQNNESDTIHIQGCKAPVSKHHLSQNLVPAKAALGPALEKYNNKRGRVVAYFLGRLPVGWERGDSENSTSPRSKSSTDTMVAEWAAVDVEWVLPYTIFSCSQVLQEYLSQIKNFTCTCCKSINDHLERLLYAMKEASIVSQCNDMDPQTLFPEFFTKPSKAIPTTGVVRETTNGETPEFFVEWKAGQSLNTQRMNSQNETQFSQGLNSSQIHAVTNRNNYINPSRTDYLTTHLQVNNSPNHKSTQVSPIAATPKANTKLIGYQGDETPITTNITQSQLNAASVLMTLTTTSPSSGKRKENVLSVTFDLDQNQEASTGCYHNSTSPHQLSSFSNIAPIVTPKLDVKKSRGLDDDSISESVSDHSISNMEDDCSHMVPSSESSNVSIPLYTQQ